MWKQRAKAHWMSDGDKNTRFFHAKASKRADTNEIKGLRDDQGMLQCDEQALNDIAVSYFQRIFQSCNSSMDDVNAALESIVPRVDQQMNLELTRPHTSKEVRTSLFDMHPLKSPGPDGLSVVFYQKFWPIVGNSVIKTTLDFLNENIFCENLNYTHIVLIPKCKSSELITQFRPISLSNVVYKIASKAVANILKLFMSRIVSEN